MLEIEEQLRRYGDAIEREFTAVAEETPTTVAFRSRRRVPFAVAAAAVLVLAVAAAVVALLGEKDSKLTTHPPGIGGGRGVFSGQTNTVLLFSDGVDGVTAVDLDHRLAGRRAVEGENAGDVPFPLTLTGDHLIVGVGRIYAAPLTGEASKKIDDATITVPAAEPGEVWTITWEGGRLSEGASTVRRVRIDGTVTFGPASWTDAFNNAHWGPLLGVPGGIAVWTVNGVYVWDATTRAAGPILGPGPATAAASDGVHLSWCEATCAVTHTVALQRTGPPTAPHIPPHQEMALSPDGRRLAVLRPTPRGARLVITDLSTGAKSVKGGSLSRLGALVWTADSRQLFYAGDAPVAQTRLGRYDVDDGSWETKLIGLGEARGPIALSQKQADSFFRGDRVAPIQCPSPGPRYPSDRTGDCTFRF